MTGGTSRAPMPTTAARVATTAAVSPIQRARRKRRSSTSVMAERYTAHSTAMKTRSSTSTTRMRNQMARAATKSATNVAPDNREEADGSVFSGGARGERRHRRPAPPPPLPCPAASTCRGTRPGERSEEHTSELQSLAYLVCRLLLEKKKQNIVQQRKVVTHP